MLLYFSYKLVNAKKTMSFALESVGFFKKMEMFLNCKIMGKAYVKTVKKSVDKNSALL